MGPARMNDYDFFDTSYVQKLVSRLIIYKIMNKNCYSLHNATRETR